MKALAFLVLLPAVVFGAPPDVPKQVLVKSGRPNVITVPVPAGAEVGYYGAFKETDAMFEELAPRPGQRRFLFWADAEGKYNVVFWTKGEVTGTAMEIVVGTPPSPDDEPEPEPVEPVIGGAVQMPKVGASLVPGFRDAWKKDPAAEKKLLPALAALYSAFAKDEMLAKYATWGELEKAMREEAERVGIAGKLVNTQTAVHKYLVQYLPGGKPDWANVVLTEKGRKSAKAAFKNVSVALAYIK